MRYVPTKEGNRWVTRTCSGNGNMGIDDQSQFKSAVEMLEDASTWNNSMLNHIVLTGATDTTYKRFIERLSDRIRSPARKHWKSAIEVDTHKGFHCHLMLLLSSDHHERLLGEADNSTINRIKREIQATVPTFDVMRVQPKRHDMPYIPIDDSTFDDAAEWLSYIFKARSKAPGGNCYGSSRSRRVCPSHRPDQPVKQNHLVDCEF